MNADIRECIGLHKTMLGQKTWKYGTANKRLDERSYEVETESGVLRHNFNRVCLNQTNGIRRQHGDVNEREEITTENPRDAQTMNRSNKKKVQLNPNNKK